MSHQYPHSRQVRLDQVTLEGLDQISRYTFQTKCSLMRFYVAKCVRDDLIKHQAELRKVKGVIDELVKA